MRPAVFQLGSFVFARGYFPVLLRQPLRFLLSGLLYSACVAALNGSATEAGPARVVRQYALTSANDFPQRDPQDWRLLASNDGGATWTTLDVRKGEQFSERHQRRLFSVANPSAFNLYRLQIDRVRNAPAADSVQLAEIELLDDTEQDLDPQPIFADAIRAQGQNPPLETTDKAFDGSLETKWLDYANEHPETRSSWIEWRYQSQRGVTIRDIAHLKELRSRATRGYEVEIAAIVAGRLPQTGELYLVDPTGHLQIAPEESKQKLAPGQHVVLHALTQFTGMEAGVRQCQWQLVPPTPPTEPTPISPEQPLASDQQYQWVSVEGQVEFCSASKGRLTFELMENDRTLSVQVLQTPVQAIPRRRARVRLEGLCQWVLNTKGERIPGTLLVVSPESIVTLNDSSGPASAAEIAVTNAPSSADSAPVLLTSIEQIRRLAPEQLVRWPKVKVRGVITEIFGAYVQEGAAGVEVWYGPRPQQEIPAFSSCVELEGRGDWASGHGPIIRADKVTVLGVGKLPKADPCNWSQLASGKMVDQWIEIEGVVRSTDGSHLLLNCEGGQLMATIRSAPAPVVKGFVDATLRVRGVAVAASDNRGRMQGVQLLVPSLEFVEVEQAAGAPFALAPRRIGSLLQVRGPKEFIHRVKVEGVLTYREDRNYFLQDATGAAMAIAQEEVMLDSPAPGWSWLFWQASSTNRSAQPGSRLEAGDNVQIVGFPEMRGYSPVLTEVLVRKMGAATPVQPHQATLAEIESGGLDSMLITLEARLLRQQRLGSKVVLEFQSGERVFQALLPEKDNSALSLTRHSLLRLTGVCQVEPLPFAELGKTPGSFKLLVRSPADLVVLEKPSWWTLRRALALAAALVVVLALAAAWIAILRRQVYERTKQLQHEITEHEKTEAQLAQETKRVQAEIEERKRIEAEVEKSHKQLLVTSRLAGMAEVATSVLHNVGNVLNSANVLASMIRERVKNSKVVSVGKLAALLRENREQLDHFLIHDSRGNQLPGYIDRLAAHLAEEQSQSLEQMKSLSETIQHIKEIVATQQNYAKISGVLETLPVTEIVEDALRMHSGAMARDGIDLIREYEEPPAVTLDRHKVLQILFNVLENARYACVQSGRAGKQVVIRVEQSKARVQVAITDNGVGIPPENLSRIFQQDFSTRRGGHGFGLHSSLLIAQEMGASLEAHSDGEGCGATFVLAFQTSLKSPVHAIETVQA